MSKLKIAVNALQRVERLMLMELPLRETAKTSTTRNLSAREEVTDEAIFALFLVAPIGALVGMLMAL